MASLAVESGPCVRFESEVIALRLPARSNFSNEFLCYPTDQLESERQVRAPSQALAAIRPTIPERVDTLIFTITRRTNAFTVFGLMAIRFAIPLVVKP